MNGTKPDVSVALCTHNGAEYIEEQMWSIFKQTYLPFEIVISDDNSTDTTLGLVKETFEKASNQIPGVFRVKLKLIQNQVPLGVTKNFEQAISNCTGELIALSDQDDVWLPNRLEKLVSEFTHRPTLLLLHHDSALVDKNLKPLHETTFGVLGFGNNEKQLIRSGQGLKVLLKRNVVTGATTVFRKQLFYSATPFPESWIHDEWLAIVAASIGEIDYFEEPLVLYRQHGNNQIGASRQSMRTKIVKTLYPRTKRNECLLRRAQDYENFINSDFFPPASKKLAVEKVVHEMTRSTYPKNHLQRLKPIMNEIRRGGYKVAGQGMQDVVRDLLQSSK